VSFPARKISFFILKIIVALLVMILLIHRISLDRLITSIRLANLQWIFYSILLLPVNLYLQFIKWRLIVRREVKTARNRQIAYSLLVGSAFGLITPGRLGDFARTLFISHADWVRLMGLLTIDKFISLAVLYLLGIIGFSHFISLNLHLLIWFPILMITVFLAVLILVIIFRPFLLRDLVFYFHRKNSRFPALDRFLKGIEMVTPQLTLRLSFFSMLQTLTYCLQLVFFVLAFENIRLWEGLVASFAVMFSKSLLPISLGDLGIRESAAVFFFGHFNISSAAAFNASFLLFTLNVLLPALLGLLLFLFKRYISNSRMNGR